MSFRVSSIVAVALLLPRVASAQTARPPVFDGATFGVHEQDARWLFGYSEAVRHAREALDRLPNAGNVGADAFCIDSDPVWDCFYGRYDAPSDRYVVEIHMRAQADGPFNPVAAPTPPQGLAAYARAIATSRKGMPPAFTGVRFTFNPYVRTIEDRGLEVWWLPAPQPDGTMIFGGELRHRLDPEGRRIVDTQLVHDRFQGVKAMPDRQMTFDNRAKIVPTVGQLFFMIAYHDRFKANMIASRDYVTTLVVTKEGELGWVQIPRPSSGARP